MSDIVLVTVPLLNEPLEPPPRERVRALKRHLVQSLRDLRAAKRPERLAQKTAPPAAGFTATVMNAGCATCQGHCCKGGGDHAYIDGRTMYRVRRDNPDLDAAAIIGLFLGRLARPLAARGAVQCVLLQWIAGLYETIGLAATGPDHRVARWNGAPFAHSDTPGYRINQTSHRSIGRRAGQTFDTGRAAVDDEQCPRRRAWIEWKFRRHP
jgi:hypothetical protein